MKFNLSTNNINYVKILYNDDKGFAHCAKTYVNNIFNSEICACIKKEEKESIPPQQEISLGFACENGLYKATSTLKYTKYEEPYLYFYFGVPESVDFQQNREYFRVNMEKEVIITYKIGDSVKNISANIHDISANGVGVKLDSEIKFSNEVLISIYFSNYEINTKARFVRTDTDDNFIKSSFNFINLSKKDTDYLSKICIKKQIQDKRNTLK